MSLPEVAIGSGQQLRENLPLWDRGAASVPRVRVSKRRCRGPGAHAAVLRQGYVKCPTQGQKHHAPSPARRRAESPSKAAAALAVGGRRRAQALPLGLGRAHGKHWKRTRKSNPSEAQPMVQLAPRVSHEVQRAHSKNRPLPFSIGTHASMARNVELPGRGAA